MRVTIVAWAGVGKSTLVNHWLRRMAAEHYRSAQLVFGWSFYRQGTSGGTSSADEFIDAALAWFGDPDPRLGTAWEKGERLAKLISHRRTLLVSGRSGAAPKSAWSTRRPLTRPCPPGALARAGRLQQGALRDYHADADLAVTSYFLGDFEAARQYARHGAQLWRSDGVQSYAEEYLTPVVSCLIYWAMSEWHFGEIAYCGALMDEAISIAKELKDMNSLAMALSFAAALAYFARDLAEVDRFASELIELSTRHNFAYWLAHAESYRGWARSALGNPVEGISWIEQEIRDIRATGTVLGLPTHLARKAEALHLAGRTSEALEAINEAEALTERFENRYWSAELHRLRAVFLAAIGAQETQIEASFCEAIRIAKKQKSVSLEKRAEATYAEYRRQKASAAGGRRFRLPLC